MANAMTIAERLTAKMEESGIDVLELTVRLRDQGYAASYPTVHQWVKGIRTPRSEAIPELARALRCTPNDLYGVQPVAAEA